MVNKSAQNRALLFSTLAFTVCFAVWIIFSVIGVQIKENLNLNETQFGLLVASPILTGSISRLFLGIWSELYGGRLVFFIQMMTTALCTWLLTYVNTYPMFLLAALGVGLAGGSFIIGVSYCAKWFPKGKQGTALGIFGAGCTGAAITNFSAPFLLIHFGWEQTARIYAIIMFLTAIVFWFATENDPVTAQRHKNQMKSLSFKEQLAPLYKAQVWRFSLYYFCTFGGFVALASWLPRYYMLVYKLDIRTAGILAAMYSLPAAIFRALGGALADKYGARQIMYITFIVALICTFILSYPPTTYTVEGIQGTLTFRLALDLVPFVILLMILGFFMSLGMAAVYKHIPTYYPHHVGSVGGLVGMIGGLGGFFLPIAFGIFNDILNIWTSCFMLLYGIMLSTLIWMHTAIRRMEYQKAPEIMKWAHKIEAVENDNAKH